MVLWCQGFWLNSKQKLTEHRISATDIDGNSCSLAESAWSTQQCWWKTTRCTQFHFHWSHLSESAIALRAIEAWWVTGLFPWLHWWDPVFVSLSDTSIQSTEQGRALVFGLGHLGKQDLRIVALLPWQFGQDPRTSWHVPKVHGSALALAAGNYFCTTGLDTMHCQNRQPMRYWRCCTNPRKSSGAIFWRAWWSIPSIRSPFIFWTTLIAGQTLIKQKINTVCCFFGVLLTIQPLMAKVFYPTNLAEPVCFMPDSIPSTHYRFCFHHFGSYIVYRFLFNESTCLHL